MNTFMPKWHQWIIIIHLFIHIQGKEVAVNIIRLAEGTVIFEDIALDRIKGTVLKTLKGVNSRRQSDPLAGRIGYTTAKG